MTFSSRWVAMLTSAIVLIASLHCVCRPVFGGGTPSACDACRHTQPCSPNSPAAPRGSDCHHCDVSAALTIELADSFHSYPTIAAAPIFQEAGSLLNQSELVGPGRSSLFTPPPHSPRTLLELRCALTL